MTTMMIAVLATFDETVNTDTNDLREQLRDVALDLQGLLVVSFALSCAGGLVLVC